MICILDLIGLIGFAILNCILGGQALASVTDGDLSWRFVFSVFVLFLMWWYIYEITFPWNVVLESSLLQLYPLWYRFADLQFLIGKNAFFSI